MSKSIWQEAQERLIADAREKRAAELRGKVVSEAEQAAIRKVAEERARRRYTINRRDELDSRAPQGSPERTRWEMRVARMADVETAEAVAELESARIAQEVAKIK